jgi:hemerythrin
MSVAWRTRTRGDGWRMGRTVMALYWKDDYSTGVSDLDEQHKVLINNLNKFYEIVKRGEGAAVVSKMFDFLETYAQKHFAFEEKWMAKVQCPVAEQNKLAHQRFIQAFLNLRQRFEAEGADEDLLTTIHNTLETWLLNHISTIDVQLRQTPNPDEKH